MRTLFEPSAALAILEASDEGTHPQKAAATAVATSPSSSEAPLSLIPVSPSSGGPSTLASSDAPWDSSVAGFCSAVSGGFADRGRFGPPWPPLLKSKSDAPSSIQQQFCHRFVQEQTAAGRHDQHGPGEGELRWVLGPNHPAGSYPTPQQPAKHSRSSSQQSCHSQHSCNSQEACETAQGTSYEDLQASLRACLESGAGWEVQDEDLQLDLGQHLANAPAGVVHKGIWRGATPVAVKMFNANIPRELWAFRAKVSLLTRLRHPNIVQLLGVILQPPRLGSVSELCSRPSLYFMLHRRTGLRMLPQQRLTAALHTARALAFLHSARPPLMHGDVKTANLFMDDSGMVKLAGFWMLEEVKKQHSGALSPSRDGHASGRDISESSPEYWWPAQMRAQASAEWMAPEALRGDQCDEKSDVFSFGVILWELATGDAPWHQVPNVQVVQYLVGCKGERLPVPDDIHPTLNQLIHDCWQEDPAARPSMADVHARLSELHEIVPSATCQSARVTVEQAARQEDPTSLLASWQGAAHPWQIHHADLTRGQRLGVGAFGEVFHGWWHTSTEVAIKVLLEQELSPDELRGFKDEVTIMSKLRHPNVVQFLGAVLEPGHLAIVTEYMPAGTLFRQLHRPECAASLTGTRRLAMAKDVARGLQYLHSHRPAICHRDLKSPNLLCERNGTVKLADFGLSIAKQATFVTGKGTPAWMAPEALRDGRCDEKSDVFSYGVVLWELATGDIPWKSLPRPDALPFLVANGERLRIPDDIHPEVQALIADCWHEAPSKRPTCGQILERLSQLSEITPSPSRAAAHRATSSVPAA